MDFKFRRESITANNDTAPVNGIGLNAPDGIGYLSAESGGLKFKGEAIGGGVTDYNDLENKPCWTEYGEMVEILPETTTVEDSTGEIIATGLLEIPTIGQTYSVTYNGEKYECIAFDFSLEIPGGVGLGDIYTMSDGELGESATGEPFVLMCLDYEGTNAVLVMPLDGATSVTISISFREVIVHKLDEKYLPDWVLALKSTE